MDIKSVGNNSLVDLSGWVEVESAKETQMGEINRVTGRELDDVRQQIEGPAAQCSSLADRLKTEAVRLTIAEASKERLDRALGGDVGNSEAYAQLNARCRAAWNAMADLESLTGREIALVDSLEYAGGRQPSAVEVKTEKARALLNDAVKAQEQYAAALDEYARTLPEESPQRAELAAISRRARQRAENVIALWTQLRETAVAAKELGLKTEAWVALNRRGYVDEIYRQEAKDETLFDGDGALASKFRELRETFGRKSLGSVRASIANVFHRQVAELGLPECVQYVKMFTEHYGRPQEVEPLKKPLKSAENLFEKYKAALSKLVGVCEQAAMRIEARSQVEKAVVAAKKAADRLVKGLRCLEETARRQFPTIAEMADDIDKYCSMGGLEWRVDSIRTAFRRRSVEGVYRALTNEDLAAVLVGRTPFSSAVESMVWNPTGNYGNDLDGLDLIRDEKLGAGVFNTVKLCTFGTPSGKTVERVFRPELGAASSLEHGAIGYFLVSQESFVGGFVLNNVAQNQAEFFHCDDVFPKTMFGTLHGEPGMFLEKAPGHTGGDYRESCFTCDEEFKSMTEEQRMQVSAEVSRKLNRLQWLDILSGQIDRHVNNLMIGRGTDGEVSVKGIDNDECFPDCDIGNGRYVFKNSQEAKRWLEKLNRHFEHRKGKDSKPMDVGAILKSKLKTFAESGLDEETKTLFQTADDWRGGLVLDLRDLDEIDQHSITSIYKNIDPPDHIDAELLDTLKNTNLAAYGVMLKDSGLSTRQVMTAKARLIFARTRAGDASCRKVRANEWVDNLNQMTGRSNNLFDKVNFKRYMRLNASNQPAGKAGVHV